MPSRRQRSGHELAGADPQEGCPASNARSESGVRRQGHGIEGGNATPAEGDAVLAQESVGLVPQTGEAKAAAVPRQQIDIEVPGGLAGGARHVSATHLVLVVGLQAEPETPDDRFLLEGGKADSALPPTVGQDGWIERQGQQQRVLRVELAYDDRAPVPGRKQRLCGNRLRYQEIAVHRQETARPRTDALQQIAQRTRRTEVPHEPSALL